MSWLRSLLGLAQETVVETAKAVLLDAGGAAAFAELRSLIAQEPDPVRRLALQVALSKLEEGLRRVSALPQ